MRSGEEKETEKRERGAINRRKNHKKLRNITPSQCLSSIAAVKEYLGNGITEIEYGKKETCLCCIMTISGIDIFHYSDEDINSVCNNFAKATTSIRLPHKYVFTDKRPDLSKQLEYMRYKHSKSAGFAKAFLRNQIKQTEYIAESQRDKLAYLMVFADKNNIDALKRNCEMYIGQMQDTTVRLCDKDETYSFLRKYLSCADKPVCSENSYLPVKYEKHQGYSVIDNRYVTTMIVNSYPASIKNLELASLIQRLNNVTVTLDVDTKAKSTVTKELNNSIRELNSRFLINRSEAEDADTTTELHKLRAIRDSIVNGNELMMYTTFRIIVSDGSYQALLDHVDSISKMLEDEGITAFIPINEMRDEFANMLRKNNIANTPFPLHDTYKMQYPFYYQQHLDSKALIFGTTGTGGLVALDFSARDSYRQSYDLMFMGVKGAGKSATLKSLARDFAALGNKIMILDVEGEYHDLADMFESSQVIRLNKYSILNVLQLRKTIDSSREDDASNETNFAAELSRISTFFYQYIPSMTELEAEELKDIVYKTYISKGISENTDVTLLRPQDFPVFSDVLKTLRQRLYGADGKFNPELTNRRTEILERLEIYLKQLAEGIYSSMFNGYSNIKIDDSDMIVFDVKSLSEMDERVYNAQLFNILTLMWSETCKNVEYNNRITNPYDRRYVVSLIDEAHRFINAKNLQVTEFIEKLVRRTRKYDAGLWFASQSVSDFNPGGDSEGAERIRVIFSLVQYKLILKQSAENIDILHQYFPQFTMSELNSTTEFIPGEMLLSIGSGRNKLHCVRYIDDATMLYVGNSRDREEIIHRIFDELYHSASKEDYALEISQKRQYFHDGFSREVMEYLGYTREDSEQLYKIVYASVELLICEFLSLLERTAAYE